VVVVVVGEGNIRRKYIKSISTEESLYLTSKDSLLVFHSTGNSLFTHSTEPNVTFTSHPLSLSLPLHI
jgi:hypothetical protein